MQRGARRRNPAPATVLRGRVQMGRLAAVLPVLALAAAPAAAPAAAAAARTTAHARDFQATVPLPAAHAAAAAGVATGPIRAPRRFDLIGFRWSGSPHLRIAVRARRDGGAWSRWVTLSGGDGPRGVSDPAWAGGSDVYELRLSGRPAKLVAHFVDVPRFKRPARAVAAAAGAPAIIPRSAWDPNHDCDPRHAPKYGRVDMGFVHHTDNLNGYSPADSASIVLAICRYHEDSNGWWDIGYDYLVDKYGQVFEGRAGGETLPVIGAHTQGYNSVSFGVSAIGTYMTTP